MTLRSLAASLAAAALMLGAAAVAVPDGAAAVDPPPEEQSIFELNVNEEVHIQPGGTFSLSVGIWREGDLDPAPDPGSRIAVKITYPEQLEFKGGSCAAYVFDDDLVQFAPYEGGENPDYTFESGNECLVDGGLETDVYTWVDLEFSYRAAAFFQGDSSDVPPPGVIGFAIDRTVDINDSPTGVGRDVDGPRAEAASTVVYGAPYLASVNPANRVTWPGEEFIEVDYVLRAPRVGATVPYVGASTSWDLRGPAFATLIPDDPATDAALCDPASLTDGYCHVTFTQMPPTPVINEPPPGPEINAAPPDPEITDAPQGIQAAVLADPPSDRDVPLAESCGGGYCDYLVRLRFRPPAVVDGNAVTGEFTMGSTDGWLTLPPGGVIVEVPPGAVEMPPTWMQDAATSHTVVKQLVETAVTLSADSRPAGGAEISAQVIAKQFPDADILAAYLDWDEDAWLEVALTLSWPAWLTLVGDPVGCDGWTLVDRTCILRFYDSPPGEGREIGLRFAMPSSVPFLRQSGEVGVSASRVDVMSDDDGDFSIAEAPTSTVIPSSAPFEVYQPILTTTVELSSSTGWAGGDDVVATFSVERIPGGSSIELEDGVAEVRLSWPDFLTPVGPPGILCEDFLPDPGANSGTCKVDVANVGPPGPPVEFEMTFAMPPDGDDPAQTGVIALAGVSLTVGGGGSGEAVYDDRYILPSSAEFSIDVGVFAVEVALDRSVSTPGGIRLQATVLVTYAHEANGELVDPLVGIALDWPALIELTEPPGIRGCDELRGRVCYLSGLESIGDTAEVTLWFDMPASDTGIGEVSATAASLCSGPIDECKEYPTAWVGSDAEPFAVVDPRIDIDVVVDRDTGWTGGQPITATVTVTHAGSTADVPPGTLAERLPGLIADLTLLWPDFLTPVTISGCDEMVAGGACRVAGLDEVGAFKKLSLTFAMPAVEVARTTRAGTSRFPATGEVRVRGLTFNYLAPPPTPLPAAEPTPTPTVTASPSPSIPPIIEGPGTSDLPTPPECSLLVIIPGCVPPAVIDPDPVVPDPVVADPVVPDPVGPDPVVAEPVVPEPVEPVVSGLRPERIGSGFAQVTVIQPKVTIVPRVARPGEVVTIYLENLPPEAAVTTAWSTAMSPALPLALPPEVTFAISRQLIVRRAALGVRDITVHSVDGRFGDIQPAMSLLVVARSTVADELVGRGG